MKFFLVVLLAAILVFPVLARAEGPSAEALAMAHVVAPPTLRKLCTLVIHRTVTYMGVVNNVGIEKADALFSKLMDEEFPKFGPKWEVINAKAYEGLLTPAQMTDMASGHPSVLTILKFKSVSNEAGARIQQDGKPVLLAYSSAVLADAMKSDEFKHN